MQVRGCIHCHAVDDGEQIIEYKRARKRKQHKIEPTLGRGIAVRMRGPQENQIDQYDAEQMYFCV